MENLSTHFEAWRPDAAQDAARARTAPYETGVQFASVMSGLKNTEVRADTLPMGLPPELPEASPSAPANYTVASGDTLSGIVQNTASKQGIPLSTEQRHRLAMDLAAQNRLPNANRIKPGQILRMEGLQAALQNGALARKEPSPVIAAPVLPMAANVSASTQNWLANRSAAATAPSMATSAAPARPSASTAPAALRNALPQQDNPVLRQTLDRAVARGFIPAREEHAVYNKIIQLSQKYRFAPDDFARMSLMESDGFNPKASNERCHGIIQFCDGPNRGAAAVGFGQQPKAILGLSVYQQLHLVDNYFQNSGLGKQGPSNLDDLYLTVLQPAARQEKQAHAPLNIPGSQARDLYTGSDTSQPITRQSIVQGLLKNTRDKLSSVWGTGAPPKITTAQNTPANQPERAPQVTLR